MIGSECPTLCKRARLDLTDGGRPRLSVAQKQSVTTNSDQNCFVEAFGECGRLCMQCSVLTLCAITAQRYPSYERNADDALHSMAYQCHALDAFATIPPSHQSQHPMIAHDLAH